MIIAGGTYSERCIYPEWDRIFGSGLRAAVAASGLSPAVTLHTYVPDAWREDVEATLNSFGIEGRLEKTERTIVFEYLDSLQRSLTPIPPEPNKDLEADGDVILRFGMMEGSAKVTGDRVVYDPQSSGVHFSWNGSSAKSLAMIVNEVELLQLARVQPHVDGSAIREAVIALRETPNPPQVVVVKDGLGGMQLFVGDEPLRVPSYAAESYFRIGAGDVIATAFTHAWGELRKNAVEAADYAARALSYFVEGARLPLAPSEQLEDRKRSRDTGTNLRLLGVGNYEVKSLVLQTAAWIHDLNGTVRQIVLQPEDLQPCDDAFDLLILGSRTSRHHVERLAEKIKIVPVIFWPGGDPDEIRGLFPGAIISRDYASALYHAMRKPEA